MTLADVYHADEAFFTGTAAEVTGIRSLDDRFIGQPNQMGPITSLMRTSYEQLVRGQGQHASKYLTPIDNTLQPT